MDTRYVHSTYLLYATTVPVYLIIMLNRIQNLKSDLQLEVVLIIRASVAYKIVFNKTFEGKL